MSDDLFYLGIVTTVCAIGVGYCGAYFHHRDQTNPYATYRPAVAEEIRRNLSMLRRLCLLFASVFAAIGLFYLGRAGTEAFTGGLFMLIANGLVIASWLSSKHRVRLIAMAVVAWMIAFLSVFQGGLS